MFIVVANNSAGSLAQPAIGVAFDAGPGDVGWVVFGFSVALSLATAVWDGLARWMGLGPALATGTAIFAVGNLAAAIAPSLGILVAARVVQGLGAGAIPTLSDALIARRYDGIDRTCPRHDRRGSGRRPASFAIQCSSASWAWAWSGWARSSGPSSSCRSRPPRPMG